MCVCVCVCVCGGQEMACNGIPTVYKHVCIHEAEVTEVIMIKKGKLLLVT